MSAGGRDVPEWDVEVKPHLTPKFAYAAAVVIVAAVAVALAIPRVRAWVWAKIEPTYRQVWPRLVWIMSNPLRLALGVRQDQRIENGRGLALGCGDDTGGAGHGLSCWAIGMAGGGASQLRRAGRSPWSSGGCSGGAAVSATAGGAAAAAASASWR